MKINLKGVISQIEGFFPYITIGMGILTVIAGILIIYLVGLPIYLNTLQLPNGLNPQGLAYIATRIAFLSVGYSFIVNAIGNINLIHIKSQLDEIE
jgi:hypothetical protein